MSAYVKKLARYTCPEERAAFACAHSRLICPFNWVDEKGDIELIKLKGARSDPFWLYEAMPTDATTPLDPGLLMLVERLVETRQARVVATIVLGQDGCWDHDRLQAAVIALAAQLPGHLPARKGGAS